jgi:uncharacterized membrane-anchored protein
MHIERRTLVKVPEVTAIFWIVKALTTGMGETTSDFFIHRVGVNNKAGLIVVVLIAGAILAVSLAIQLAADRYKAPLYWFTVLMVAITGTMAADAVHVELGCPTPCRRRSSRWCSRCCSSRGSGPKGPCRSTAS